MPKKFEFYPSVYLGVTGPETETEAECRFYREIGSDILGYSLVPENIAMVHAGIKCAAFCMLTRELVADRLAEISREEKNKNRAKAEKALALAVLANARATGASATQISTAMTQAATATAAATSATAAHATAQRALATATAQANVAIRASSGVIAALGGPIGALITLLGVAATAWFVFGDKAEKATDKALNASKRVKDGIKTDLEIRELVDGVKDIDINLKIRENPLYKSYNTDKNREEITKLKKQKAQYEKDLEDIQFNKTLDSMMDELDNLEDLGTVAPKASKLKPTADANEIGKDRLTNELDQLEKRYGAEDIKLNAYFKMRKDLTTQLHDLEIKSINDK